MKLFRSFGKAALFSFDAETAHGISIKALKSGLLPACPEIHDDRLVQKIAGLEFPNPVGLAAGYDKNAEVPDAVLRLGFGFTEVGTLTPRPQSGNPKPRVFRLLEDEGVINRFGFNNDGHGAALKRLRARSNKIGIVGINIGANKDSENFVADYEKGISAFSDLAHYFTANISSPNTPGLRNLQAGEALKILLDRIFEQLERIQSSKKPPVFLKVAPDLDRKEISAISKIVAASPLSGLMVSNTTLSRHGLVSRNNTGEAGGLSGKPLFERSTIILARFREQLPESFPLVGIGGIDSAESAWQKLEAGASLVQLYSGMVYQGPGLAHDIVKGLLKKMDMENIDTLNKITARRTSDWAVRPIPGETR